MTGFRDLELLPEKAAWHPATRTLLLADLHLGKTNHFQKAGIPIPTDLKLANMSRLFFLIKDHQPEKVLFLGDLFHSRKNNAWEDFTDVIHTFKRIRFELILGNHDIIPQALYDEASLAVHAEPVEWEGFMLSHEPLESPENSIINICGHIHPGVGLLGGGRQRLTLPCFFYCASKNQLILPAFGQFTGLHRLRPAKNDRVFVVLEDSVREMEG